MVHRRASMWFPLLVCLAGTPAAAAPFTLTLDQVVLSDGGQWEGFFTWVGDGTVDWSLHAFGGDTAVFPEVTSTPANSVFGGASPTGILFEMPAVRARIFSFDFVDSFLDGSALLTPDTHECFTCSPFRTVVSGGVIGTGDPSSVRILQAPEPLSGALFLLGVCALSAAHRHSPLRIRR